MGAGSSQEAEYTLRDDLPAGAWHLVGDGIITQAVDVRFELFVRRADTTEVPLVVSGTVQFKAGFNTSANQITVRDAIAAFANGKDIGDPTGIDLGGIYAAIYAAVPNGVQDVDLSSPSGDSSIASGIVRVADSSGLTFS